MDYTGIENTGIGIKVIVEGFGAFSVLASKFLAEEGLGTLGPEGIVEIDPNGWYPIDNFRRAFKRIGLEVGSAVVTQVGKVIPKEAKFPPAIKDIDSALGSLDIAMHMNHRKHGRLMFDPLTGEMLEGIGHLAYSRTAGKNEIIMTSDSLYPCAMDLGLITAMAQRFQPRAKVLHDHAQPCKEKGGTACRYIVTW